MGRRRWKIDRYPWLAGVLIATVAAISASWGADLHAPPRFDGAGYAVLAQAISTGQGYREIDRPGSPRHAHFPPGYPAALALVWKVVGRSAVATHCLSLVCVVGATILAWLWFRRIEGPEVAARIGLALAFNWTWARTAGAIQSEPLFLFLGQLALLMATRAKCRGGILIGMGLGLLLGSCILTRHVGIALAAAVCVDLLVRKRLITLLGVVSATLALILPWVVWLVIVRENTQAELLIQEGLVARVATLSLFYLQRIPDVLTGPVVEVGTVFIRSTAITTIVMIWASVATGLFLIGSARTLQTPRRRLAGLTLLFSLALLLVWPFTEAGRFLIPLVPCLLVAGVEGLSRLMRFTSRPKVFAATLLLASSVPYSVYALATNRSQAQRQTHANLDAACSWLAHEAPVAGPVLTRHPGEVFWLAGRQAVPAGLDGSRISRLIETHQFAYLLVDEDRYANAPANPITAFLEENSDRARLVWSRGSGKASVRIYEIVSAPALQK